MKFPSAFRPVIPAVSSAIILILLLLSCTATRAQSVNIAPMTWTPRPDWIVVTGTFTYNGINYHAAGDGVTDDTAAIQAALNVGTTLTGTTSMNGKIIAAKAVYLPAGTYKITSTLHWRNFWGGYLVGCGCNTTIQWYGGSGASMFWADGAAWARFVGITWDGRNIASCAYQHMNNNSFYAGRCRHENEAFKNFTISGSYMPGMVLPASGIISGISDIVTGTNRYAIASGTSLTPGVLAMNVGTLISGTGASPITGTVLSGTLALRSGTSVTSGITVASGTVTSGSGTLNLVTSSTGTVVSGTVAVQLPIELGNTNAPTAEMLVTNCLFQSCSNGIIIGYNAGNDYQWLIDGCEFESWVQDGKVLSFA